MPADPQTLKLFRPGVALAESDVRRFLELRVPESLRVEYKQQLPHDDKLLRTIAAMANTSGGVVLVGVTCDGATHLPLTEPSGVTLADRDRLMSQAHALLEPLDVVDVTAVELGGSGRYVLVLRVDEHGSQAPVVVRGRVYVRLEGQTVPASRQQIIDLVGRSVSPGAAFHAPLFSRDADARRGPYPLLASELRGLAVRLVLDVHAARWLPPRRLGSKARGQFLELVETSSLEAWLRSNVDLDAPSDWEREGPWTSSSATFARRPSHATVAAEWTVLAQAALEVSTAAGARNRLYVDVAFTPAQLPDYTFSPPRQPDISDPFRFTPSSLCDFLDAFLVTATTELAPVMFTELLGTEMWERSALALEVNSWPDPLETYIRFGSYPRHSEARDHQGSTLIISQKDDISDATTRRIAILDWLELLYLNHGFWDFEPLLDELSLEG